MTVLACRQFFVTDGAGNAVSNAMIEVRTEAGSALASLYSDRAGTVPIASNPFAADSTGFAAFFVVGGAYRVRAYVGNTGAPSFEKIEHYVAVGRLAEQDTFPAPTAGVLGGVFSSTAPSHNFANGVDTSGNVTYAQPGAADLSDGVTGTTAVVRALAPAITTPAISGGSVSGLTAFGLRSSGVAHDILITSSDASLTANRALNILLNDASAGLSLKGDVTLGGPVTVSGAFPLVWNLSGSTNLQLPTTGTLATVAGAETPTNKSINASNNTITNLTTAMFATSVIDTDATLSAASSTRLPTQSAVKSYVDNNLTGLTWKTAVLVKTTGNITLSGEQTIDGTLTSASRVLAGSQSTASQNGIYVSAAGAWTRALDMDAAAEFPSATVFVEKGTVNGDTQWTCTNDPTVVVGTTAIVFAQVSGAGTYSAGAGLQLSGNQFLIDSTVVTLTGSQVLTNKDLSSGTNTFPTFNQNTTGTAAKLTTARNIDGQAFDGSANITVIAPGTHAATGKTTPVDADELPIVDSAASNVLKKLTWANLKATLKTYLDTLYSPLDNSAWTAYTPVVSSGTGAITTASATGRYKQIGKTVFVEITITLTTNGSGATSLIATLPVNANAALAVLSGGSASAIALLAFVVSGAVDIFKYDGTYPGASGGTYYVSGCYEAA